MSRPAHQIPTPFLRLSMSVPSRWLLRHFFLQMDPKFSLLVDGGTFTLGISKPAALTRYRVFTGTKVSKRAWSDFDPLLVVGGWVS